MVIVDKKVKDALARIRAGEQELHKALSDAAAKRGGATKADLEAIPQKAKAVAESLKGAVGTQNEAAKKHLKEAAMYLEGMQKHAAEGLKRNGDAFQTSVRQTLADARASIQRVSEAVAAERSAESPKART
jgi:fructose-specific phosphotransferase system component IIB